MVQLDDWMSEHEAAKKAKMAAAAAAEADGWTVVKRQKVRGLAGPICSPCLAT